MDIEPMICPECGSKMIKRYTGISLDMYPPGHPWYWWCGNGHEAPGGIDWDEHPDDIARREWKRMNNTADGKGE